MRTVLYFLILALALGPLAGCSSNSSSQSGNNKNAAPPPQDSGADKTGGKPRIPPKK